MNLQRCGRPHRPRSGSAILVGNRRSHSRGESDEGTASDSSGSAKRDHSLLFDIGGCGADASQLGYECDEGVAPRDLPNYTLKSVTQAISATSHQECVNDIAITTRTSHSDQQPLEFCASYTELVAQNSRMEPCGLKCHTLKLG